VREVSDLGASVTGMAGDLKRMIEENRAKEQAKRAAEIHLLRSQMDPHFLSNALNTIRTMATLQGADGIARMAECLARIFRAKLGGRDETASVREELALLEDYMYIQRIRYSGRVTLRTQIADDAVLDCRILRFLLQPIVENAVFHGLEPKGSEGEIVVQVQRRDGVLLVGIRDDGVGMSDGAESSKGIGIRNIRERIALAYGDAYGMSIESRPGSYTEVRLRLPACAPPAASKPDAGGAA
jgi:two-component system sensor histidine kinase YesM